MLFVSWQLKATVYIIFLTVCLGQELFRTCERDYCFERSIEKQRFEREQSRRLTNEQNRILENQDVRLSIRIPRDYRMKREIFRDVTNRFVYRTEDGYRISNLDLERLQDTQESAKRLNNNQEENDRVLERIAKTTRERIFDRDFDHEQVRFDASQEDLSIQELERRLDNRENQKVLNNNREKNYKVSERFDERQDLRISGRVLEKAQKERRANSKLEEGSYLDRRLNIVREFSSVTKPHYEEYNQKPVNRKNILQQFDAHETSKPLYTIRDERQRNENLERRSKNREEQNERVSVSRRQLDSNGYIQRHDSLRKVKYNEINRRSENINELNARKINRKMDQELENQLEINKERHNVHEINRRSENRRNTERVESFVQRRLLDDHNARRDISDRQMNLLSVRYSENQAEIKTRGSENISQNRRVAQFDTTGRSVNRHEASRRVDVNEHLPVVKARELENFRAERNLDRNERQETRDSTRDNLNANQESHPRLHNSELQRTRQSETNKLQHENLESRTVTQNREELVRDSRPNVTQGVREQRSRHLADERKTHLRQIINRENEDKGERAEVRLVQRAADREVQNTVNKNLASCNQDNGQRTETRRTYEREIKKNSQDNQRSRLDISEKNARGSQPSESSRQYDERKVSYDEKYERKSIHRNERYRNVEMRMNDQGDNRFADNELLERNNAFIIKTKTTNSYYRNNRFIEEDNIEKPTVLLSNVCTTLGQSLLFAYLVMKTCNGKTDLINQLQRKLRGALLIIGF